MKMRSDKPARRPKWTSTLATKTGIFCIATLMVSVAAIADDPGSSGSDASATPPEENAGAEAIKLPEVDVKAPPNEPDLRVLTGDDLDNLSYFEGGGGGYNVGGGFRHTAPTAPLQSPASANVGSDGGDHSPQPPTCLPVIVSSGNKIKKEVDFVTHHRFPATLERNYNYTSGSVGIFGGNWSTNVDMTLGFATYTNGNSGPTQYCQTIPGSTACSSAGQVAAVTANRPDGSQLTFSVPQGAPAGTAYTSSSPTADTWIAHNVDGSWSLMTNAGAIETYSAAGQVVSAKNATGVGWTNSYSGTQLQSTTYTNSLQILYSWAGNHVSSVKDTAGQTYTYGYNANGFLNSVVRPTETRTYFYENSNLPKALTGIAINGGRYSTYSYFPNGQVQTSGLGDGTIEESTFSYGSNYTQVTNAAGAIDKYTYQVINSVKLPVQIDRSGVSNCPNTTSTIGYDSNGNKAYQIDSRGIRTNYTYTSDGHLTDVTTGIDNTNHPGQSRYTHFVWDTSRDRVQQVWQYGADTSQPISETVYTYYPSSSAYHDRLQTITIKNLSQYGNVNQVLATNYSYQIYSNGLPSQVVVSSPIATLTTNYDTYGNVTQATDASGNTSTFGGYNGLGLASSVTDQNGYKISHTYDAVGHILTSSRTLDGVTATTTYQWGPLDKVSSVTYPDSTVQIGYLYDNVGRLIRKDGGTITFTDPDANRTTTTAETYTYNNLSKMTLASGSSVSKACHRVNDGSTFSCTNSSSVLYQKQWSYDSLGRVIAATGNNGQSIKYTYDGDGNILTKTDASSNVFSYTYNSHNQVETITDPQSHVTKYTYDGSGKVSTLTDAKNNPTNYYHDGFGNVTTVSSPDSGITSLGYFSTTGLLQSMSRADGTNTTFTYDALGRTKTRQTGSLTTSYSYDTCTNGHLYICSVNDSSGSTSYTYRVNGQIASKISTVGGSSYTTAWSYDTQDRVSKITYPGGNSINYSYDDHSEPTGVTATIGGTTSTVANNMSYVGFHLGPRTALSFGNGTMEQRAYDKDLRLTSLTTFVVSTAANNQALTFAYNTTDQLSTITNTVNSALTQSFSFDPASRLSGVTSSSGNQSFTFDGLGSRTSQTLAGAVDTYNPDANSNRLTSISGSRSKSFSYDSLGNLHQLTGYNGNQTYNYDANNHMSSITTSSGTTSYLYDYMGSRVRKSGPSGTTNFGYDKDGSLLFEANNGVSTPSTEYIWLQGQLIGLIKGSTLYYVSSDQLNRPESVATTSGSVVWRSSNFAYDRTVTTDNIGGLNIGFPGQYFDVESGLYYNVQRYYDSTTGRYLQSDPTGLFGGLNTYAYTKANPAQGVDPTGTDDSLDQREMENMAYSFDALPRMSLGAYNSLITYAGLSNPAVPILFYEQTGGIFGSPPGEALMDFGIGKTINFSLAESGELGILETESGKMLGDFGEQIYGWLKGVKDEVETYCHVDK